jgi:hypothetical protein
VHVRPPHAWSAVRCSVARRSVACRSVARRSVARRSVARRSLSCRSLSCRSVVFGHQGLGMLGLGSGVLDRDGRLGPSLLRYKPTRNTTYNTGLGVESLTQGITHVPGVCNRMCIRYMCFKQDFLSPEWFWKKFVASRRRQRNAYAPIEAGCQEKTTPPCFLAPAPASNP